MTQGKPLDKQRDEALLCRKIARRADTLHILALLLQRRALAHGDTQTADLIAYVLAHVSEGDTVKLWLMEQMKALD